MHICQPHREGASFVRLPNEIKDIVFDHLATTDILHVAATCKALYEFALPLAYRNLTLTWTKADRDGLHKRCIDLLGLLRTLKSNPNYGQTVQALDFQA